MRDELKQIEQDISDVKAGKGVVDPAVAKDIDDKIADLTVQLRGLKDRNYYNRELERLNSQLNHLEADRRADEKYVFESKDPKVLIKELEDQIVDNEKQILSNITEIKKAEKARSDAKKKAADTQLKIKEITNEIRDLDQQISSKSSDDKSWVDYNSEKVKLEAIVAKATRDKVSLEGKIKKQEEKNKVHRTIRKWGNRVQATATQLQAVQMGPLTAEAKRKEIMKLMKTLDLSFTKAPESKGKFDFNSLTDDQKAQIAAILNPTA